MTTVQRTGRDVRTRFPVPRPDAAHWPGLATVPQAPVHARIARTPHHAPAGVDAPVGRTAVGTRNQRENRTGS